MNNGYGYDPVAAAPTLHDAVRLLAQRRATAYVTLAVEDESGEARAYNALFLASHEAHFAVAPMRWNKTTRQWAHDEAHPVLIRYEAVASIEVYGGT